MSAISLDDVKSQLRIDSTGEDYHLSGFIQAAETYLENYLGQTLDTIKGDDSDYPWPLKVWLLIAVGQMNNDREGFSFGDLRHESLAHYRADYDFGEIAE